MGTFVHKFVSSFLNKPKHNNKKKKINCFFYREYYKKMDHEEDVPMRGEEQKRHMNPLKHALPKVPNYQQQKMMTELHQLRQKLARMEQENQSKLNDPLRQCYNNLFGLNTSPQTMSMSSFGMSQPTLSQGVNPFWLPQNTIAPFGIPSMPPLQSNNPFAFHPQYQPRPQSHVQNALQNAPQHARHQDYLVPLASSYQIKEPPRFAPTSGNCCVCKVEPREPKLKYCSACANARARCANENCEAVCGPGYIFCYHCNPTCPDCKSKISLNNNCSACQQSCKDLLET